MLERTTQPDAIEADEPDLSPIGDAGPSPDAEPAAKGRGATPRKTRGIEARAAKRIKGHTIYLPDDLFERLLVQAHRRNRTISEYVAAILDRQVPDHRTITREPVEG